MKLVFPSHSLEMQCRNKGKALRLFGGNEALAVSLLARINALEQAETIHDIIVQNNIFHFHNLRNRGKRRNLDGCFAIDVKSHKDPWRIILQLLDELEQPYSRCHIDEIAKIVRIVKIVEVSKHYD